MVGSLVCMRLETATAPTKAPVPPAPLYLSRANTKIDPDVNPDAVENSVETPKEDGTEFSTGYRAININEMLFSLRLEQGLGRLVLTERRIADLFVIDEMRLGLAALRVASI